MSGPDPWDALDDEVDSDWEEVQVERSGDEAEEVEVSPEDEEYQLEEEFQDQLQEEFEELHHLEVEEEKGESDDEIVPGRESDLKLTDVPEDMREAVQGSLSLKRILNEKYGSLDETAKRRRLDNEEPEMEPERQQLLERWKLVKDPAARYVIQTANSDDVLDVKNTEWNPSLKADRNPSFVLTTVTWP
ncbi:unnamed protein product [Durusdinium trenchii]|uniref:Clathrin light chain n=1 Tax=Durusdinium trenchii TaxID=1381693 RepID=A0ABP0M9K1_9DINO